MEPILSSEKVTIGGQVVTVRELSALEYLDYMDYVNSVDTPEELPEGSSPKAQQKHLLGWRRVTLLAHSRLVAYGLASEDIDEAQKAIQQQYNTAGLQQLNEVVARLSGFSLDVDQEEAEPAESQEVDTKK